MPAGCSAIAFCSAKLAPPERTLPKMVYRGQGVRDLLRSAQEDPWNAYFWSKDLCQDGMETIQAFYHSPEYRPVHCASSKRRSICNHHLAQIFLEIFNLLTVRPPETGVSKYQETRHPGHSGIDLETSRRVGDQHGTDFDQPRCRGAGGVGVAKSSPTFDLGMIGNIISGLVGGGVLGQIVTLLLPTIMAAAQSGNLSVGGIISQAIAGGAGGTILTAIIGAIKNKAAA
jgi:hypothetical protein